MIDEIRNLTDDVIIDWVFDEFPKVQWLYTQIYCIKRGVKSVIGWLPVVYHDRWWDHSFLYSILRYKLNQMEKGFRKQGHCTNSEKDADNVKKCVLLLDRLIKDDYIDYNNEKGWTPKIRLLLRKEEEMINQDLDLLFKTIRKQIRAWWD
jgi:hypothetical protein